MYTVQKLIKMKNILYFMFLSSVLLFSCGGSQPVKQSATANENKADRIEVIYFHAEHRCQSCLDIEANTKYTLETFFSNEMEEGNITYQTFNIDDEKNYAKAEKFQTWGSALFLNVLHDGKSNKIELTNFAFLNCSNQLKFSTELQEKISNELKTLAL